MWEKGLVPTDGRGPLSSLVHTDENWSFSNIGLFFVVTDELSITFQRQYAYNIFDFRLHVVCCLFTYLIQP